MVSLNCNSNNSNKPEDFEINYSVGKVVLKRRLYMTILIR
jgi:hypothetical protein